MKRALARRPEDRFASCAAFADAIVAVEPAATSRAVARSLGALVQSLRPAELDTIAAARAQLAAIDENPSVMVSPDATEGMLALSPHAMGQTESVSRSLATAVGDVETDATAPVHRRTPATTHGGRLAAALGVVVVVAVVAIVVVVAAVLKPPPAATVPTVATTAPVAAALVPVVSPPVVAAPVAPVGPVASSTRPAVDPEAESTARAAKLFARIQGLRGCDKGCVQVLRTLTLANIRRDPKGAGDLLQDCKEQCSQ